MLVHVLLNPRTLGTGWHTRVWPEGGAAALLEEAEGGGLEPLAVLAAPAEWEKLNLKLPLAERLGWFSFTESTEHTRTAGLIKII